MKFDLKKKAHQEALNQHYECINMNHSNDNVSDDRQTFKIYTYLICCKLFACICNNLCVYISQKECLYQQLYMVPRYTIVKY